MVHPRAAQIIRFIDNILKLRLAQTLPIKNSTSFLILKAEHFMILVNHFMRQLPLIRLDWAFPCWELPVYRDELIWVGLLKAQLSLAMLCDFIPWTKSLCQQWDQWPQTSKVTMKQDVCLAYVCVLQRLKKNHLYRYWLIINIQCEIWKDVIN